MNFIISRRLSSGHLYAYYKNRFWFGDEVQRKWTESHLMSKKYEQEHTMAPTRTPEAFMADCTKFQQMDAFELDPDMLEALKNATPCKSVPVEPVAEERDASEQDKSLTIIPDNIRPEFDYSGLSEQTVADLHLAENEYIHGKKLAERGLVHMGDAIAIAHDALCGTVVAQCDNGKFAKKEDTFRSWCCSIGITKDSAYRLLQVSALMEGSSPRQKEILEALPPTLLYAVAKPSAPQELVEKVKNGEVSSNKEYQALLKENQQLRTDRVNAMNQADREKARADRAVAEIGDKEKTIQSLLDRSEAADARAEEAESHYKAALSDLNGLTEQNSQLRQSYNEANDERAAARLQCQKAECERDKAEQRAKDAEAALKKQPITAVVDEEEVDKRAHQQAYAIAADMTSELREQLAAAQSAPPVDPQEDIETATSCIVNITGIWSMATPTFTRLIGIGEDFDQLADALLQTCDRIKKEVIAMIAENDGGLKDE